MMSANEIEKPIYTPPLSNDPIYALQLTLFNNLLFKFICLN